MENMGCTYKITCKWTVNKPRTVNAKLSYYPFEVRYKKKK